jgi:hypothetical protein
MKKLVACLVIVAALFVLVEKAILDDERNRVFQDSAKIGDHVAIMYGDTVGCRTPGGLFSLDYNNVWLPVLLRCYAGHMFTKGEDVEVVGFDSDTRVVAVEARAKDDQTTFWILKEAIGALD